MKTGKHAEAVELHISDTPARTCAGSRVPTPQAAADTLVAALQEQADWEARARAAKELLGDMLRSRREAADLAAQYDTRCVTFLQVPHLAALLRAAFFVLSAQACSRKAGSVLFSSWPPCLVMLPSVLL